MESNRRLRYQPTHLVNSPLGSQQPSERIQVRPDHLLVDDLLGTSTKAVLREDHVRRLVLSSLCSPSRVLQSRRTLAIKQQLVAF